MELIISRIFVSLDAMSMVAVIWASELWIGYKNIIASAVVPFANEGPRKTREISLLQGITKPLIIAVAINKIGIEAIRNDPAFKDGYYDVDEVKEKGMVGLAVGRMAGHLSFLNESSMREKFGRNYTESDGLYELFGRFEVERYLEYNGHNFSKNFDPLSYLYAVKTMNIFNAARGSDTLEEALSKIKSEFHLISFKGDVLFFPEEMHEIYEVMCKLGKRDQCSYLEVDSDLGHDAFLIEVDKFSDHILEILGDK